MECSGSAYPCLLIFMTFSCSLCGLHTMLQCKTHTVLTCHGCKCISPPHGILTGHSFIVRQGEGCHTQAVGIPKMSCNRRTFRETAAQDSARCNFSQHCTFQNLGHAKDPSSYRQRAPWVDQVMCKRCLSTQRLQENLGGNGKD